MHDRELASEAGALCPGLLSLLVDGRQTFLGVEFNRRTHGATLYIALRALAPEILKRLNTQFRISEPYILCPNDQAKAATVWCRGSIRQ